jgi:iron(III) transport system substrate-binding protein
VRTFDWTMRTIAGLAFAAGLLADVPARADADWDKVVASAKQEGQVIVWGEVGATRRAFWKDAFEKENPGITVDLFQTPRAIERDSRYQREREAGIASVDLFVGGSAGVIGRIKPLGYLQPIRPFMKPEILDDKVWMLGAPLWLDHEKEYMLISDYQTAIQAAVNSSVGEKDLQSWEDLLDPKYDGKIVMGDPRSSGPSFAMGLFIYYETHLGADFFRRFFAHGRVVFQPDTQQAVEWIDSGRMLVGLGPNAVQVATVQELGGKIRTISSLKAKGKPVAFVLSSDGILILTKLGETKPLPHPNATKVYINWFYSKAGQQAMVNTLKEPSYRKDVDLSAAPTTTIRQPEVEYVNMNDERFVLGDAAQKMRDDLTAAVNAK